MAWHTLTAAREAMATRFELALRGPREALLRGAAEEALDEIERLEAQLSLFQPSSEIAHLNRQAAQGPVRVEPRLFELLERARALHEATDGAFDITIGPLVRAWGFLGGPGARPDPETIRRAAANVGMPRLRLDRARRTVSFSCPGMMLDLGAIGKGYAVDCAVEILREAGVPSGLVHGGTSTVFAFGDAEGGELWQVMLPDPRVAALDRGGSLPPETGPGISGGLGRVSLRDEAVAVSGVWGKAFVEEDRVMGHVLDPRRGEPATVSWMGVVVAPTATDADALSTALLVLGPDGVALLENRFPEVRVAVAVPDGQGPGIRMIGGRLAVDGCSDA